MKKYILLVLSLIGFFGYSQADYTPKNPSTSSLMSYNDYPIELSTGLPNVSVPIYSLPTRSKSIGVDLALKYHPSSIAVYDSISGDCGRGWSLINAGAIAQTESVNYTNRWLNYYNIVGGIPSSNGSYFSYKNIMNFHFMGYSGKITISNNSLSGLLEAEIEEKDGNILTVDINYSTTDFVITSIVFYDDKGYSYRFQSKEEYLLVTSVPNNIGTGTTLLREYVTSGFKLNKVFDNNAIELLNFEYNTYTKVETYHEGTEKNTNLVLNKITSLGYGSVEITNSLTGTTYDPKVRFTNLKVKNFRNELLSDFDFIYNIKNNLIELKDKSVTGNSSKSHYFYYKSATPLLNEWEELGYDLWGYPNSVHKFTKYEGLSTLAPFYFDMNLRTAHSFYATPHLTAGGVLEKMVTPTGGSVIYEYESNTYSYYENKKIEYSDNVDNSALYYESLDHLNKHNFTKTEIVNQSFNSSSAATHNFTISGSKKVYFMFYSPGHSAVVQVLDENQVLQPTNVVSYPTFELRKDGILIDVFQHGGYLGIQDHGYSNKSNNGFGKSFDLTTGNYSITINNGIYPSIGQVLGATYTLNATLKKWEYAAGIRVKRIGYFTETDVQQNYYTAGYNGPIVPAKEVNYSYNFFNDVNRSSGTSGGGFGLMKSVNCSTLTNICTVSLANYYSGFIQFPVAQPIDKDAVIRYANVTMYESGNNGKVTYDLYTHQDFTVPTYLQPNQKILFGKPKEIKTYNAANTLIASETYSYDVLPHPIGPTAIPDWVEPTTIISKQYINNAIITDEKKFTYNYANRRLASEETKRNNTGDVLKKNYFYHAGNSIFSKNRVANLERTETFLNTELLGTSQVVYSNVWSPIGLDVPNVSFLPSEMKASKGSHTQYTSAKITKYDSFSNTIEIIQENGIPVSYIWGYNATVVVAKLVNVSYSSITPSVIDNIKLLSNGTNNEATLITALNALRTAFPNGMVTTYTYKPMVGLTTVTDAKGDRVTYSYDLYNRLKEVRDKNNNIVSENEYYNRANQTEQNFIKSKTYKIPTTTSIATPTPAQASQGITYYDGLGRTVQAIAHAQSGAGKDIISHVEYDALGRQSKNYLPFASTQTTMAYVDGITLKQDILNYYQTTYGDANPFSEQVFESSPWNRVLEQAAPGNDWSLNSPVKHTVRYDYTTNVANEVKMYKAQAVWNATKGLYDNTFINGSSAVFYDANTLQKSVVKNENWQPGDGAKNTTEEFKDRQGQLVMKRVFATSIVNNVPAAVWHETYNVYDQYGNLAYVLPPNVEGSIDQPKLDNLCYQYRYDHRNRLVEKKEPGKLDQFMVYDKLDRLVAVGPALSPFTSPTGNGWMISKYDNFNRVILSGWMPATISTSTRKILQDTYAATSTIVSETKAASNVTVNGVAFRYTNAALPTTGYHVLTVNYFDDYNTNLTFTVPIAYTAIYGQTLLNNTAGSTPKGLPTASWVRVLESSTNFNCEKSYLLYDSYGRVIRTFKNNYLGGYTLSDNQLETITGRVNYTETKHKRTTEPEIYIKNTFTYTAQDRLLTHTHQIGVNGTPQLIAKNDYNALGQLISKQVGGTDTSTYLGLQKVDYSYNIRGWLKGINDVNALNQGNDPLDLFAFKLNYNEVENVSNYNGKKLYNGNISETYWRTSADNVKRKYGYFYDEMSRLTSAVYQKGTTAVVTNSYNESMTYDKNGNIQKLIRNGDLDDLSYNVAIDNLDYAYHDNRKNELRKVVDNSNIPSGFKDSATNDNDDYDYDTYGNMTVDNNKGIFRIDYNHLNLPTKIMFGQDGALGTIEYLYNSIGQKVEKKVTNDGVKTNTDYLDGFQYIKVGDAAVVLDFLPHAEGYVKNTLKSGGNSYNYAFNYTDHLGNVRLTFGLSGGNLVILEENQYYPYGMKHKNYNVANKLYGIENEEIAAITCIDCSYKYKYNGKEYQDELGLNMTAMDMRMFDSAIARWVVQDPIVHHSQSQYNGFDGNPVFFADPSGGDAMGNEYDGIDYLGRNKYDNRGIYLSPLARGDAQPEIINAMNDFDRRPSEDSHVGGGGNIAIPGLIFDGIFLDGGPGALFNSALEAAIDFGNNYNGFSIINSIEVFTIIYQLQDGKYSYLTPYFAGGGFVDASITRSLIEQVNNIKGATIEADAHTHGADAKSIREFVKRGDMKSSANKFSGDYKETNPTHEGDLYVYKNLKGNAYGKPIKGYMCAPNGGLYFFDPSVSYGQKNRDGSIRYEFKNPIYSGLPSDPYQGKQRLNNIEPTIVSGLKFQNY